MKIKIILKWKFRFGKLNINLQRKTLWLSLKKCNRQKIYMNLKVYLKLKKFYYKLKFNQKNPIR